AAAARTRTQRPGKHLAVHASELVVKPDFQILRRYRRPLLLRLEHTHRPALEDYVHRATRLGSSRSLNLRIGIRSYDARGLYPGSATRQSTSTSHSLTGKLECVHLGARAALADLIARAASCDYPSAVRSSVQRTLRLTASVATIADGNSRSMPRDRN